MRANTYAVASRCIEEGIEIGIRRFNKHKPEDQMVAVDTSLVDAIHCAVVNELSEYFTFDEGCGRSCDE